MHGFLNDLNIFILNCLFVLGYYACYLMALVFAYHGAVFFSKGVGMLTAFHIGNKMYGKTIVFFLVSIYSIFFATVYYLMAKDKVWGFLHPYFYYNIILTIIGLVLCFYLPFFLLKIFSIFIESQFTFKQES